MSARVLLSAQKPVGEAALDLMLAAAGIEIVGLCSNTDAAAVWWKSARVAEAATKQGTPFLAAEEATPDALECLIDACAPDWLISIQHSTIIPRVLLERVQGRALNLHLAPLPAYRGFYGPTHALLNGDSRYGISLHWMSAQADAGDLCVVRDFDIDPEETGFGLYRKSTAAGIDAAKELITLLQSGRPLPRMPQTGQGRMYKRDSLDGKRCIDGLDDAAADRTIRAFAFPGFEPAYFHRGGKRYHVLPDGFSWTADMLTESTQR